MSKLKAIKLRFYDNLDEVIIPHEFVTDGYIYGIKKELDILIGYEEESCEELYLRMMKKWTETNFINYNENDYELAKDLEVNYEAVKCIKMSVFDRIMKYKNICGIDLIYEDETSRRFYVTGQPREYECTDYEIVITLGKI